MSGIGLVYFVDPPGLNSKSRNLRVVDLFSGSAAVGAALSNVLLLLCAAGARARGKIVLGLERELHLATIQGYRNGRTRFAGG